MWIPLPLLVVTIGQLVTGDSPRQCEEGDFLQLQHSELAVRMRENDTLDAWMRRNGHVMPMLHQWSLQ